MTGNCRSTAPRAIRNLPGLRLKLADRKIFSKLAKV